MLKDNLILVGFMGCGKTTVGLKLSFKLKTPVEDTDKLIENREKRTINEIFAAEGEEYFRQLETEILKEIPGRKYKRIISLGGGTPVREENRKLLKNCGKVVYLRIQPETVYERLKDDTSRPLLRVADPLSKIREMLEFRGPLYEECADIIIDVDDKNVSEITDIIEKALR